MRYALLALALLAQSTLAQVPALTLSQTFGEQPPFGTDGLAEFRIAVGDSLIIPDPPEDLPPQCINSIPIWIAVFQSAGVGAFWTTNSTGYFRNINDYEGWPHRTNFLRPYQNERPEEPAAPEARLDGEFEDTLSEGEYVSSLARIKYNRPGDGRNRQPEFWNDRFWLKPTKVVGFLPDGTPVEGDELDGGWQTRAEWEKRKGEPVPDFEDLLDQYIRDVFASIRMICGVD